MERKIKVGDKVKFLRSHNKAVELAGEVLKIDGNSVDIKLNTAHDAIETAHLDDVTLDAAATEKEAAEDAAEEEAASPKKKSHAR
jgi:hypothetical protein